MSTLTADTYHTSANATAPQRSKTGLWKRVFAAMTASRQAEANRAIFRYYSTRTDADLRELGVSETVIAHVRKHYR